MNIRYMEIQDISATRHHRARIHALERRAWPRLRMNWELLLFRSGALEPIPAALDNISSGGLLLIAAIPLSQGEAIEAEILIPESSLALQSISLKCCLKVLRSELLPSGDFAIGCQLEDYNVRWPDCAHQGL